MNKENLNNQNLSKLKEEKRRYGLTTKKLNTISAQKRIESYKKEINIIGKIYKVEENKTSPEQHSISYPLLKKLYKEFYRLNSTIIKNEITNEEVREYRNLFRNFINIGISSPINFYSLPFRRIINKAEKLVKIFKESNQQIYEYAEIVLITAYEIIKEKNSPYIDEIRKQNMDKEISTILLNKTQMENLNNYEDSKIIKDNINRIFGEKIKIIFDDELLKLEIFDNILAIGPPKYFDYHVFLQPKTQNLSILCYDFCFKFKSSKDIPCFIEPFSVSKNRKFQPVISNTDEDIDISILTGGKISINDISNIHTENISNELGQNRKSVITILAKNKFVYLCNHEGIDTSQPVLLEDDNGFLDVKKMEVRDLKAGMHVLLRTEGGSTLLVEFANQILGENKENYRNLQQGWKSILKEGYIEKGMNKLKEFLNDNGANDLNISNAYIKRWINDDLRSIGPKEKNKKFLEAVITLKNYQDKFDEYWNVIKKIRSAHSKAGDRITQELKEIIKKSSIDELRATGYQKFSHSGGGTYEVYRINEIGNEIINVKSNMVDRPYDIQKKS